MSGSPAGAIRVLVVEDEQLASEAHAAYVGRTDGFELGGVARSAGEALRELERLRAAGTPADLLLLDLHLPDGHGLGLLQRARAEGHRVDAVAVTSARDVEAVRQAVSLGVVLYLLKPFTYAGFRAKLQQYAAYRDELAAREGGLVQDEVDALLGSLRSGPSTTLPKGLSPETLREVVQVLRSAHGSQAGARSASEVAEQVGASRVTVRRYLEHLADRGDVVRSPRYGRGGGRPELEYSWAGRGDA